MDGLRLKGRKVQKIRKKPKFKEPEACQQQRETKHAEKRGTGVRGPSDFRRNTPVKETAVVFAVFETNIGNLGFTSC